MSNQPAAAPLLDTPQEPYRDDPTPDATGAGGITGHSTPDPHGLDYGSATYDPYEPTNYAPHAQRYTDSSTPWRPPASKPGPRRTWLILGVILALLLIAAAVVIPVYFLVIRPQQLATSGSNTPSSPGSNGSPTASAPGADPSSPPLNVATSGGDGSIVTKDDGSTFVYNNKLGGFWVSDPANPLNNSAQPQAASPPLSQPWKFGTDKIYGVNLGGWLVLEPFISPALFEKYVNAPGGTADDEWKLSLAMRADTSPGGGIGQIEEHYKTFITEEDFARIAAAGLNWVRIPLGYWAIEVWPGEPWLEKVAWTYFLKAIGWARKYGIRINVDLHTAPGSQNGWNHSGKGGQINFMNGVMGVANAQRTLDYIRIIAEFISQPQYRDVVQMFGVINEPRLVSSFPGTIPDQNMREFYLEAHKIVRTASGTGEGNGPYIAIHDAFQPLTGWAGFLSGSDRVASDSHLYFAFGEASNAPLASFVTRACDWSGPITDSMTAWGFASVGEWSLAVNDCGLFVNGVPAGGGVGGTAYEGAFGAGACTRWTNWPAYDAQTKQELAQFMLTSMDSLQNSFFWTWRIGNSSVSGRVEAPAWSYMLAIEQGWAPTDPRTEAPGACQRAGTPASQFTGALLPWQTGGVGAGQIDPGQVALYGAWPPTAVGGQPNAAVLPRYTPTGLPIPTLPVPAPAPQASGVDMGNGWNNPADTTPMNVEIAGCTYPDAWNAVDVAVPPPCPS